MKWVFPCIAFVFLLGGILEVAVGEPSKVLPPFGIAAVMGIVFLRGIMFPEWEHGLSNSQHPWRVGWRALAMAGLAPLLCVIGVWLIHGSRALLIVWLVSIVPAALVGIGWQFASRRRRAAFTRRHALYLVLSLVGIHLAALVEWSIGKSILSHWRWISTT